MHHNTKPAKAQIEKSPFMKKEQADALASAIRQEFPTLEVAIQACDAPYVGFYIIDVTHQFHMVIKSPENWEERKRYIKNA